MSIATKGELKTALQTWLERSGDTVITAPIDDFIRLTEARINRTLPLREMWLDHPLTGTISSRELALPTDFIEAAYLRRTTGDDFKILKPKTVRTLIYTETEGEPSAWAVNGNAIDLNCPCDAAHTFILRYRQALLLAADGDTNWLLTNYPDVYLFGCLAEVAVLTNWPEMIPMANGRFQQAVEEVSWLEGRTDSLGTLSVDDALLSGEPVNYSTGEGL